MTFFILATLAVGCTPKGENSAVGSEQGETVASQFDKARTETKEAAQAMQDYAYAQKADFVDMMKKELAVIQEELDQLSARVDSSSTAAKADAKARLDAIREQWALAKKQLDQAESATEDTWDDVKAGFKRSYGELKDSYDKTRQWLSDKIQP
jgi:chromosome segregation ATPase